MRKARLWTVLFVMARFSYESTFRSDLNAFKTVFKIAVDFLKLVDHVGVRVPHAASAGLKHAAHNVLERLGVCLHKAVAHFWVEGVSFGGFFVNPVIHAFGNGVPAEHVGESVADFRCAAVALLQHGVKPFRVEQFGTELHLQRLVGVVNLHIGSEGLHIVELYIVALGVTAAGGELQRSGG